MLHILFRACFCIDMQELASVDNVVVIVEVGVQVHDGWTMADQESCEDLPARAGGTIDLCLRTAR
jgi:hypothetical protein